MRPNEDGVAVKDAPVDHAAPARQTFVETALKLSGKSEEEARRTGAVDRADEQVEALFAQRHQTTASPIHRAVWDAEVPIDHFAAPPVEPGGAVKGVMDQSMVALEGRIRDGTLFDAEGKVSPGALEDLGRAGYWGLLIPPEYGGVGAPFSAFAAFLTRMATRDATVASLASVHGCIGAVDPLLAFGSEEQKRRLLPPLASGQRLSGFALTEPNAGSDLTALRTTARLEGDRYLVNGEKLFITNAIPGRTVGLVCLIDAKPAVLIADLPAREDATFQLRRYGLWALKHLHNNGLVFRDFPVPRENLLMTRGGDGLTIAYHGLNRGRVSLCAAAAGSMKVMLASMLPWARFRVTYGQSIDRRELVRRRIARMAGLIVGSQAMTEWCGWLLDQGFRGEMECIIAKIFGSEAQKTAAIELLMKTHGGRAFLRGHLFGDNAHEYLAPCIYEGEGEMLGMAFFKSLVKRHGSQFFEPIGKVLAAEGIKQPNPLNPSHAWKLRKAAAPYVKWQINQRLGAYRGAIIPALPGNLSGHARFAAEALQRSRFEIDGLMRRHALSLPDRQCAMAELSQRVQDMVVMLVTALWAGRQEHPTVHGAAQVLCAELRRRITGHRQAQAEFRAETELGRRIADGEFPLITGVEPPEILMKYAP